MKTLLQQGAALLLALSGLAAPAYAEQENAAGEKAPCTDLQCLICPQLNDPAQYASGRMKLLATLTPGKDNWLFRSMVDMSNQFGIPKHMEPEFKRFMDTFKAKGINVVIAVQPTRGLMHRDKFYPDQMHGFDYLRASNNMRNFLDQMRRNGAIVPDIMPMIENPPADYFFRRDHHWTPIGSEITARITADEIKRQPFYADLTKKQYTTSPGIMLYKDGTLNIGLARICGNNFGIQYIRGYETVPADTDAASLFDDETETEVILVGTSNSAAREDETKQYNFDGFLKEYLSVDLLNFALPGAGQDGALTQYLLSPDYDFKNPPKMIIWELPASYALDTPFTYRQLIPAINGGCKARPDMVKTKNQVKLNGVKSHERIELLSNAGSNLRDFRNLRGGFLDLKISDKNLKHFYIITYYDNGERDKIWIRREAIVEGGQYYLEFSRDPRFEGANLLSVFMEPTQDIKTPLTVDTQVCL